MAEQRSRKVVVAPELLEQPPRRTGRLLGAALLVLAMVAAGLFAAVQLRRGGPTAKLLEQGRQALAASRYDEAVLALQNARDRGADPKVVEPLLRSASDGQRDTAALAQARKALAEHRFDDARVDLQVIPASSPLHAQAVGIVGQIEPERTQFLFGQAREAIASGELEKARALQKEVAGIEPALGQQLAIDLANAAPANANLPAVALGLDRLGADPAVRKAAPEAFKLFAQGELAGAEKAFAAVGSGHKDGTIRSEARMLALATHTCAQAIDARPSGSSALLTAARACADVDSEGKPVRTLRVELARAYDAEGRTALNAGRALVALTAFRSAEAADGSDAGAKAGYQAIRDRAQALAAKARAAPGEPESRETWQALAAVLAPSDALRAEAVQALGN